MNIYVSNLSFSVFAEDLKSLFSPYGEVVSAKIINDRTTGKSRGFGFVEMADSAAANNAIATLNGEMNDGRPLQVKEARPKDASSAPGSDFQSKSPFKTNGW